MSLFDEGEGSDTPSPERPVLPYAGTSGWSGSETSQARADHDDTSGSTGARQSETLRYLSARRARGATWRELAAEYGWHHGQASGALSTLHKTSYIARLTETRDRCKVYVLLLYVDDRATEPYTPNTQKPKDVLAERIADLILDYIEARHDPGEQVAIWQQMLGVLVEYREASS